VATTTQNELTKFSMQRVDAAICEANELLKLQAELCGPPERLTLGTLREALEHVDAHLREISMLSLSGIDFRAAPVTPAKIMEQLLELRRQIEARIHHREKGSN
jgi:hypothetical protein